MKRWLQEYADFVWLPLLALGLAYYDTTLFTQRWWLCVTLGLAGFTLVEYLVHRFVLHGWLWHGKHERHHQHPQEKVVFPWWYTPTALGGGALLLVMVGPSYALACGFLLGAIWFFVWHYVLHHWAWTGLSRNGTRSIVAKYAAWHDLHHKDLPANYGITHPLWDWVFGTYMTNEQGQRELLKRAMKRATERVMGNENTR